MLKPTSPTSNDKIGFVFAVNSGRVVIEQAFGAAKIAGKNIRE